MATAPSAIQAFLDAAGRRPLLTREREIELAKRVEAGDRSARDELVESNLRLVVSVAKKFRGRGSSFEDLLQEGTCGLVLATDRFNWRRGFKFSTYAVWWIQEFCRRAGDDFSPVAMPRALHDRVRLVRAVWGRMESVYGAPPTPAEVSEETGLALELVEEAFVLIGRSFDSLDRPIRDDDAMTVGDLMSEDASDNEDDADRVASSVTAQRLLDALDDPIERRVVELRHGLDGRPDPMLLREIGGELGLSQERVLQLQLQAMRRLCPSTSRP